MTQATLRRARWHMRLGASVALVGLVMLVGLAYVVAHGNQRLVSLLARGGS